MHSILGSDSFVLLPVDLFIVLVISFELSSVVKNHDMLSVSFILQGARMVLSDAHCEQLLSAMSDGVFLPAVVQGVISTVITVYEYGIALTINILTTKLSKLELLAIQSQTGRPTCLPLDSSGETNIISYN